MTVSDAGVRSWRDRAGFCGMDLPDQPSGSLTADKRALLGDLAERIKMSHDLLGAFADRHEPFPGQMVNAQTRELAAVRVLLDRYGVRDPTAGLPAGEFIHDGTRLGYDRLLVEGMRDRASALAVAARLGDATVATLTETFRHLDAPDVRHALLHLLMTARQQSRLARAWSCR